LLTNQIGPNEIVIKYKLRDVPGTTDAVESLQHRDLIRKATRYAETYNLALKDWLEYQRKLDKKN